MMNSFISNGTMMLENIPETISQWLFLKLILPQKKVHSFLALTSWWQDTSYSNSVTLGLQEESSPQSMVWVHLSGDTVIKGHLSAGGWVLHIDLSANHKMWIVTIPNLTGRCKTDREEQDVSQNPPGQHCFTGSQQSNVSWIQSQSEVIIQRLFQMWAEIKEAEFKITPRIA